MEHFDFAIVGAGMAGASLAALLAEQSRVVLLEAEDRPGYHATGRSAAFWTESYGGPKVQPLTTASGPYLREHGFLSERGALTLGTAEQSDEVEEFAACYEALGVRIERLERAGLEARLPGLLPEWQIGVLEPDCADIDVAGLHAHYLAAAKKGGAELFVRAELAGATREGTGWVLTFADGRTVCAGVIVNAAGAWADVVAKRAGVLPIGIKPFRRTVIQMRTRTPPPSDLPLVLDIAERFYFKPEAGRLWLSPHDETESPPCDAAPEEYDVALAIDRFENVVDWGIDRIEHRWAGLRSFAPDRLPVYGFDAREPSFFWFAGQGGFGIQTAPAAAAVGAALLLGKAQPFDEVDATSYAPARFA